MVMFMYMFFAYARTRARGCTMEGNMREVICPVDGRPCDPECPDRFTDRPEGGCILTMAADMGCKVFILDEEGVHHIG